MLNEWDLLNDYHQPMTGLSIRRIRSVELADFRQMALEEIGTHYPDIDDSFAENIIRAHQNETDPIGYFTKTKTIWAGVVGGVCVGYLVGTEKRGGSVKFSPILIKEEYRGQGSGTALWQAAENHYQANGHRKVYTHAPLYQRSLFRWFASIGYHLEAILVEQYDEGQDEFIMGKFLTPNSLEKIDIPTQTSSNSDDLIEKYSARRFEERDIDNFVELVNEQMAPFYGEMGAKFVNNIVAARDRFDQDYKAKGKAIFVIESDSALLGCGVATPKRGGSVKLVPLLFTDEATAPMIQELLNHITRFFISRGHRKLYSMIPSIQFDLLEIVRRNGFNVEGIIQAPYKPGIDNVFVGKVLEGNSV